MYVGSPYSTQSLQLKPTGSANTPLPQLIRIPHFVVPQFRAQLLLPQRASYLMQGNEFHRFPSLRKHTQTLSSWSLKGPVDPSRLGGCLVLTLRQPCLSGPPSQDHPPVLSSITRPQWLPTCKILCHQYSLHRTATRHFSPDGSTLVAGAPLTYSYRFNPSTKEIGSLLTNRPSSA